MEVNNGGYLPSRVASICPKRQGKSGLDVATCGVANANAGFGLLATNFSRVVANLAGHCDFKLLQYFIFIYVFIS